MQQSLIRSTSFTKKINISFIWAFQFLQQLCFVIRHKPGKKHIIPDALSKLASTNYAEHNKLYSEPDVLFTYYVTLVKISLDLVKRILNGYLPDDWWIKVWKLLLSNKNQGPVKAILLFVFGLIKHPSSIDPYFLPRPEAQNYAPNLPILALTLPIYARRAQLIYHLNCVTGVCQLYILPAVAPDLLAIAYGKSYLGFDCCHKII